MVKTTVYVDEDVMRSLRSLSERSGKPQAQLIREALKKFTAAHRPPLPAGMGKFASGRSDLSQNYRVLLKQAVKQGRWP